MATKLTRATTLLDYIIGTMLEHGGNISLSFDHERKCKVYDLNVNFKSGIKLSIEDSELIARMRYDGKEVIKTPLDLLQIYDYWAVDATRRGWGKIEIPRHWQVLYNEAKVIPPQLN